jgi:hypothetical protein
MPTIERRVKTEKTAAIILKYSMALSMGAASEIRTVKTRSEV